MQLFLLFGVSRWGYAFANPCPPLSEPSIIHAYIDCNIDTVLTTPKSNAFPYLEYPWLQALKPSNTFQPFLCVAMAELPSVQHSTTSDVQSLHVQHPDPAQSSCSEFSCAESKPVTVSGQGWLLPVASVVERKIAVVVYICEKCGLDVEVKPAFGEPIRCRECGCRILWKKRRRKPMQYQAV